jgi:hypothetical protein
MKILSAVAFLAFAAGSAMAVTSGPLIVTAEAPKSAPAPSVAEHDVIARVNNQAAEIGS